MLLRSMMIAAFLLSVAPVAVQAQAKDGVQFSPAYDRCLGKPENDNTYGMLQCGDAEIKFQDARLNKAYKADMADLKDSPAAKAALLKAQRAWIAFRDADRVERRHHRGDLHSELLSAAHGAPGPGAGRPAQALRPLACP